jgi:uncharacterized protein YeaO (DUF488 family)
VCPLEANWVSEGFAAPGEGQEESQEAGSRSNVERADPRGGTDRAKHMTALRNAMDSLSIVEEEEVSGKKRWGSGKQEKKARISLDSSCKSSALEGHTMIKLTSVYEPASSADGARYLVERLWPRGMKKTALHIDAWLKDVAPSTALRRWFNHDPKKWGEFQRRYRRELNANPDASRPILNAAQRGNVALVYSSHDAEHNNAVVLKEYVEEKLEKKSNPPSKSAA